MIWNSCHRWAWTGLIRSSKRNEKTTKPRLRLRLTVKVNKENCDVNLKGRILEKLLWIENENCWGVIGVSNEKGTQSQHAYFLSFWLSFTDLICVRKWLQALRFNWNGCVLRRCLVLCMWHYVLLRTGICIGRHSGCKDSVHGCMDAWALGSYILFVLTLTSTAG